MRRRDIATLTGSDLRSRYGRRKGGTAERNHHRRYDENYIQGRGDSGAITRAPAGLAGA